MFLAAVSTVICDLADKARLILDCVRGKEHTLKTIVLMEAFDEELVARGQQSGIEILSLKDVEVKCNVLLCSQYSRFAKALIQRLIEKTSVFERRAHFDLCSLV